MLLIYTEREYKNIEVYKISNAYIKNIKVLKISNAAIKNIQNMNIMYGKMIT